jgi:hypothetical protein
MPPSKAWVTHQYPTAISCKDLGTLASLQGVKNKQLLGRFHIIKSHKLCTDPPSTSFIKSRARVEKAH